MENIKNNPETKKPKTFQEEQIENRKFDQELSKYLSDDDYNRLSSKGFSKKFLKLEKMKKMILR